MIVSSVDILGLTGLTANPGGLHLGQRVRTGLPIALMLACPPAVVLSTGLLAVGLVVDRPVTT